MREKIYMDNNIFNDGWNKDNAYIYGWVLSDGCLMLEGRNKNAYSVRISSNDYDIVCWLHDKLCVGNKIYRQGKNGYVIKYRNKESINFMIDLGLTERKSLTAEYPVIPNSVFQDFLRGYFDGNGSVILHKTQYNVYGQVSFASGSKRLLDGLYEQLLFNGIKSHVYKDDRSNNSSYYLRVTKRSELERLYHVMYEDIDERGYLK